jgi:anti-sigma regulatory factor (Ser/Thr protein kinase)
MTAYDDRVLTIGSDAQEISAARRFVRERVDGRVPPDVSSSLQLIVSELVSNAVEHNDARTITVEVDCRPEDAVVVVRGGGTAADVGPAAGWQVAPSSALSGRGLGIVRELADEIVVDEHDGELVITARVAFDAERG